MLHRQRDLLQKMKVMQTNARAAPTNQNALWSLKAMTRPLWSVRVTSSFGRAMIHESRALARAPCSAVTPTAAITPVNRMPFRPIETASTRASGDFGTRSP